MLVDAISKINELNKTNKYAFVVVTGDIGVEQIVKTATAAERKDRIDEGAKMMANLLASSKVGVWLFVPGNNDLADEMPDTIGYYHQFIGKLHDAVRLYQIEVVDLCPQSSPTPYIPETAKDYAFIGFNNASFKNNNDAARVSESVRNCCALKAVCSPAGKIRCVQEAEIQRVSNLLKAKTLRFAYIFYHIPEVDDPYLIKEYEADAPYEWKLHDFHRSRSRQDVTGSEFLNSSWFVDKDLRNEWSQVTQLDVVKGLFAGHLHDPHPKLYLGYPDQNNPKLYICPPLAIKLQGNEKVQARGFQEVSIDEGRDSTSQEGKVNTKIYWYDQATWLFSDAPGLITNPSPQPPPQVGFMSWETLAHMSTVAQFFVVAVSLGFIWYQLRQQTKLARIANTQALVALVSPFNLEMAQNKEMAELWIIGPEGWEALSKEEQQQYESMLRWWFIFYENIFFQAEQKLLDKSIFAAWQKDLDTFVEEQLVEKHWSGLSKKYHKHFADYLDARVKEKIEKKTTKDDESSS